MKNLNLYITKMTIVFAVVFFFSFNSFSQTSTVIRGPYLQNGTTTSTIVQWRTSNNTNSYVWYGTDVNNLNQTEIVNTLQTNHQVTVSGLVANTIYYYAVGDSTGQMEGGNGDASFYFKTAPAVGSTQPVTAWILGDCGTADQEQEMVRDAYYNYIGSNHTDMVLLLGDNAYDDGFDSEYQDAIFNMYTDKLKNSIFWSCPGNHDYFGSGLNNAYYDIFSFPTAGEAGGLASNTEKYYSFDYANIHIISLDSHDENRSIGSPMLTWLENDLAATTQEWIIVIFHHPPYSKGSHDSDDSSENRMIEMRENVLPICESYGVDLVLTGHSHSYERSKLINGHYGFSSTYDTLIHEVDGGNGQLNGTGAYQQNTSVEGTVYIVTGSAGKTTPVGNHPVMYSSLEQLGSTILEVNDNQMDVKFLNENGVVQDSLTLIQNGQPTVNWTNPTNGQVLTSLNSIALNVEAFDSDGSISQIEYFVDGASIGIDLTAPYSINWTPAAYVNYLLKATATDNEGNTTSKEISVIYDNSPSTSLAIPINDGDDDAEESGGSMDINNNDLELVDDGSSNQTVGLVFDSLNIPTNAIITNAYIQFTADETDSGFTDLTIHGEATDSSFSFINTNFNITSRPKTTDSINWIPPTWSSVGDAGIDQQTPDLSNLVQEIINRSGWKENNSMGFIISGNGTRVAESYNGSSSNAAVLHVTYEINLCAPFFDMDDDGYCSDIDCDDTNPIVNPGEIEICDGIDNDCDGLIDEGLISTYYADTDGDGFGDPNNSLQDCSLPLGYVSDNTDCDDTDGNVHPNATEICDGIDNNCDGQIDEGLLTTYYADTDGDGFGDPNNSVDACSLPTGYVLENTDCDDTNANVNSNALEVCDGIDNNCDGQTDEGLLTTYYADVDGDGFGDPNNSLQDCSLPTGYVLENTDCDDTNANVNSTATEICDGIDNNCDGQIDEGLLTTFFADLDGDGFGDLNNTIDACTVPSGYVSGNTDCDDTNANVNSNALEVCDGIDNNCDGQIDEGLLITYYGDTDGDGFGDANNTTQACTVPSGYVSDNTDCDDTASNIYIGSSCDDNNSSTINDIYQSNCICLGNFAPTVIWTNPTNGQFFTNLDPLALNVNASDSDGSVTQVEYFVDGVFVGVDLTAPYSINWTPSVYGNFLLKATATDNGGNTFSQEISITLLDLSPTSIAIQINDEDDDAEESGGDVNLGSSDLEMVEDGSDEQTVGLVFNEINIPSGSVIANAYIQFTTDETDSEFTNLTIHGEDSDNSSSFNSSDFNITSRPNTTASVNWIPPSWTSQGEAGINQQTPDLSSLVQEIVNRPGWEENNSMGFIISGAGARTAESYNGSSADAAILHITFEINPCGAFLDNDNDGYCSDVDCEDNDPTINPGTPETCDGIDNNCNGQIDEGVINTYYADTDTDGFGDPNNSLQACTLPSGYVSNNEDCDDTNGNVNPNATEICDGIDNNCDGRIDEDLLTTYYADTDGDGFGDPNNSIDACSLPSGYVLENTDCDDTNGSVNSAATEICDGIDNNCDGQIDEGLLTTYYADTDGDGFGDPNNSIDACSLPSGYVLENTDCDDTNGSVNSAATEICDGIDNDCDGQIDEGLLTTYYADTDGDGFGDPNNSIDACSLPSGYVLENTDCDDTNGSVNSAATEICDGIDNNCDGQIDEGLLTTYFADVDGDGFGDPNNSVQDCSLPSGYVLENTDCDDTNVNINSIATEICDGIDNNCDGQIDEGLSTTTYYADIDGDGFGDPNNSIQDCSLPSGYVLENTDCDDINGNVNSSATEICDGIDNNCDGQIDEGLTTFTYYADTDGDGFGDPNNSIQNCFLPSGYVSDNTDCDDTAVNIYIGATCDDGNPNTINDIYDNNCVCIGVPLVIPPIVVWTNPAAGQFFTNLDPIALNVDASDSDGSIAQVEYFANGVSIGIDIVAPYSLSWTPLAYGNYLLNATATDNQGNTSTAEISITLENISPTNIAIQINDDDDDAEESNGDVNLGSSDLEMVEDGSDEQTVGLVFNGINIPSGAVIANAYIQFTTDETDSEFTDLTIHGEATDNSLSFNSSNFNITSRPTTVASVNWIPPTWSNEGEAGIDQQTPDLKTLVQEIINRPGWSENNSMGFIISGNGVRTAVSHNGNSSDAAILNITFELNPCEPFFDADNDGFCSDVDCDDNNANTNPGAIEICDGLDNDCDGQIDEGLLNTYFADTDTDGFGDPNNTIQDCSLPSGYVLDNTDCDDTAANVNPTAPEICDGKDNDCDGQIDEGLLNTYYADTDGDGFGDLNNTAQGCTVPSGYVSNNTDCDDTDVTIHPNASEVCDGIDNNCDGQIDEGLLNIYYADTDGDGFGDLNNTTQACTVPLGYVSNNTDCDDTAANVSPTAPEICDGKDNNCNGQVDEGLFNTYYADTDNDGFGDANNSVQACSLPSGYVLDNTDCDDTAANVNPTATEICDGIDNNCNGQIDEGLSNNTYYADTDGDGFGDPNNTVQACILPSGYVSNNTDCDDTNGSVHPNATEVCDDIDNNCDGQIDEGLNNITYYADTDGDGFGDSNNTILDCSVPSGYVSDNTDCDDTDASVHPNATEVCDGIDNNCDGQIDEGVTNTYYADTDNDGFGDANNSTQACTLPAGYVLDNTDCDDTDSNIYIGATCDDGNPNTINDIYNSSCICEGVPLVIPPTISWTSPTEGQIFTNLDPLALNVNASDADGNVTQVEYFVNGVSIGIDVVAPYSLSWTPSAYGSYLLKTTATDNQGNTSSAEISITLQDISPTTISIQINDEDDDAEEFDGDVNLGSSDLEMTEDGSEEQTVGLVFNEINIPAGVVITNAYIQFTTDETDSGNTNLTIHGEDTDDALSFTSDDFDITSRSTTTASVNWTPLAWTSEGEAGIDQQTPDLTTIVQEIIDRPDWSENNSMGFIISGVGVRTAVSYNGSPEDAAVLHVTFSLATNLCAPFVDADNDGFCSNVDCDDNNPNINSSATEICDGIDNNCNGLIDEGVLISFYEDVDGDGFGDPNVSVQDCSQPSGYVLDNTDCDDTNVNINPSATEICDGIDNNCDGQIDEGLINTYYADTDTDGFGDPNVSFQDCSQPSGYVLDNTDCDDTNVNINPSATEVCDGIDNNCDGQIDEGLINTYYADTDTDGFGDPNVSVQDCSQPSGYILDNTDCDDTNVNINPSATEICDGIDNNCDGQIDEGLINTYYADTDTDGFGDPNVSVQDCSQPSGYVLDNTDCDDTNPIIFIGAACDDNDPNTINDIYNSNCICEGDPFIIPPTVTWTNPIGGQVFTNLNSIVLNVNASDSDGSVTQVEFFVNGVSIGIDVVAPYSLSWAPAAYGNYLLKATATDNGGNTTSAEISITLQDISPTNIVIQISDGDDDAEESDGEMSLTSSDLEMTEDGQFEQTVGLVFNEINIPPGATITNAYIQFTTDETDTEITNLTIHGEDTDNALSFTSEDFNITSRPTTSASVNWNPPSWSSEGEAGVDQQTPDLTTLVQEIIDRSGWSENNSMGFVISGVGVRTAVSYDGNSDDAAILHVTFSTGPPIIAPTVSWINPTEGQVFTNLNPIALNVDAFDSNGSITQVEYFVDGVSIGIDVVAPYSLNWTPPGYGNYLLKATATDNDGNTSSSEISIILQENLPVSIIIPINDEDDDAEESAGDVNLTSSDLEMTEDGSEEQTVGIVFNQINIPQGAIITNAYIQFTTDETDTELTNLTIHGEDTDNALSFTSEDFNITSRPTTTASVNWVPPSWTIEGEAGINQQTPDLAALVQEMVNRSGWEENNSMGFIISGVGVRTAVSYNGSPDEAATLHVTFVIGGSSSFVIPNNEKNIFAKKKLESLDIQEKNTLHFFPNPIKDILKIHYKTSTSQTIFIEIIDLNGKVVNTQTVQVVKSHNEFQIDLSQVPTGLYLFRLVEGENHFLEKVIISH